MDTLVTAAKKLYNAVSFRFGDTAAIAIFAAFFVIIFLMFFAFTRKK